MKFVLALVFALASVTSFAGPAVKSECIGYDKVGQDYAVFHWTLADHFRGVGYTTNEVEVVSVGTEQIGNVFDMTVPGFPTCRSRAKKSLRQTRSGKMRFQASCAGVKMFDIEATCRPVAL